MKRLASASDIADLRTIMSVWAHPDDESFMCAGIMAAAVANGQKVVCITATKGEAGVQDEARWPVARLGDIRSGELEKALKILGITKHHWLGYPDGGCHDADERDAVIKLQELIHRYQPDTILTFGPDGMTGHPDHQTVSRWVDKAVNTANITVYHAVEEEEHYQNYMLEVDKKFNIYFNIDKPPTLPAAQCDIALKLDDKQISLKLACLKSMPSQTEAMLKNTSPKTMTAMLGQECFVLAK